MNEFMHNATVVKIEGGRAFLRISDGAENCQGCALSGLCNRESVVDVPLRQSVSVGDNVKLRVKGGMRRAAILWLLAMPLAMLIAGMLMATWLGWGDALGALCGISLCAIWYAIAFIAHRKDSENLNLEISHLKE